MVFAQNFLLPVVVAVVTWIATNFFADPILRFNRTRAAIYASIYYTGNVGGPANVEEVRAATDELRRLSATLRSLWHTSPRVIKFYFSTMRGYNLVDAAAGLIGVSNNLNSNDGTRGKFRRSIILSLKLKGIE
ncbi:MAG TPA: hypothetical protein VHZ78_03965 [Rhizomicrobium sp.]|jgi:hypothetical protein|nr:hypothetical protein [Rhizomicrobium sp.]